MNISEKILVKHNTKTVFTFRDFDKVIRMRSLFQDKHRIALKYSDVNKEITGTITTSADNSKGYSSVFVNQHNAYMFLYDEPLNETITNDCISEKLFMRDGSYVSYYIEYIKIL